MKAICLDTGLKWNNLAFYAENVLLQTSQDNNQCLMIPIVRQPVKLHDLVIFMSNDRLKSSARIFAEYKRNMPAQDQVPQI